MDNTLSPIQMLDKALRWFAMDANEWNTTPFVPRQYVARENAIESMIQAFPELNTSEFLAYSALILDKLIKDEHVKENITQDYIGGTSFTSKSYSITFKGKLFSKDLGGYIQQKINADRDAAKDETDERLRKENEKRMTDATEKLATWTVQLTVAGYTAGVGTIGLLLWEIWKSFHPENF